MKMQLLPIRGLQSGYRRIECQGLILVRFLFAPVDQMQQEERDF